MSNTFDSTSAQPSAQPRVLANAHCGCGENPIYDNGRLLWEDIPRGRIFALDLESGDWGRIYEGAEVGGFTLQSDDSLLLFRDRNIARLQPDGSAQVLVDCSHLSTGRFNDVIAAPDGGVFAGTMGRDGEMNGGLFRVERDGSIQQLWSGTSCSNGMAFTKDQRTFFWADTSARQIWALDYDRENGALFNKRLFWESNGQGAPDGLTIDRDENLWVAFYDRGCVRVISPQAQVLREIAVGAKNITSCAFGGPAMSTLFITSASGQDEDDEEKLDGALFVLETETSGREEFRSEVLLDKV